jgi:hypothetical protein
MDKRTRKAIIKDYTDRNCKVIFLISKSVKIKYICECGIKKEKMYSDFMKNKECRTCRDKKLKEKPKYNLKGINGEEWKPIIGGWISNYGNAKNSLEKDLTLCPTKFRYHIGGKNQYVSRLIAEAFEIKNFEKLVYTHYCVSKIDISKKYELSNIVISTKSEIGAVNGKKARSSDTFKEKNTWCKYKYEDIESISIKELPKHTIYKNGEIFNDLRFLSFSKSDKYLVLCTEGKTYKVHRLICFAFHPIEGKNNLIDYEDLQVNHIDGNTYNNNADNLEWVSSSENMLHSYKNNLNNKIRSVLQFSLDGEFIKEYVSITEASRQTDEPQHRIRTIAQGKTNNNAIFNWKFKNEEETNDYKKKYSVR